jgi:hypothetical protein
VVGGAFAARLTVGDLAVWKWGGGAGNGFEAEPTIPPLPAGRQLKRWSGRA